MVATTAVARVEEKATHFGADRSTLTLPILARSNTHPRPSRHVESGRQANPRRCATNGTGRTAAVIPVDARRRCESESVALSRHGDSVTLLRSRSQRGRHTRAAARVAAIAATSATARLPTPRAAHQSVARTESRGAGEIRSHRHAPPDG